MRKFLWKCIATIVFLLLVLAGMEYYVRQTDESVLRIRRDYLEANKTHLDGLVFGPSLIVRAINPAFLTNEVAMLGVNGSTPRVDYLLFKRFIDEVNPKFIIMDLSVGYLDRGVRGDYFEQNRLYHYFGIRGKDFELKDFFLLRPPYYKIFEAPDSMDVEVYNEYGFALVPDARSNEFKRLEYDTAAIAELPAIKKKIRRHNRTNDERYQRNLEYYREIGAICSARGIELIFVSPPKYHLVDGKLTKKHYERRSALLDELTSKYDNVQFWDFDSMHPYDPEMFLDSNHSSVKGAKVVSREINRRLKKMFN